MNHKIAVAQVIDPTSIKTDKIVFGAKVTMFDIDTEADINVGKISIVSPVGRALVGHRVDEEVNVTVPSGVKVYEVTNIEYS